MVQINDKEYGVLKREPTDDQLIAVEKLSGNSRFLLSDATGLGKTYSALCGYAAVQTANTHLLVLCPRAAVKNTWQKEIEKYTAWSCKMLLTEGKGLDDGVMSIGWDITICSYSAIAHFTDLFQILFRNKHVVLVLDEADVARNPKAQIGKAARYFIQHSGKIWGLTATPLLNHIEDLYHVVNMIFPGYLGRFYDFMEKYTVREEKEVVKRASQTDVLDWACFYATKAADDLMAKGKIVVGARVEIALKTAKERMTLVDMRIDEGVVRNTINNIYRGIKKKSFVLKECFIKNKSLFVKHSFKEVVGHKDLDKLAERLKPIMLMRFTNFKLNFIDAVVKPAPEEEELYLLAAQGMLGLSYKGFVQRLPDLQLAANNSTLPGKTPNESGRLSSKEQKLVEIINGVMIRGVGCIVYTEYHLSVDRLKRVLEPLKYRGFYVLTGKTPTKEIARIKEGFSGGEVLLMTEAGGKSLNLQAADTVVFYDLPWAIGDIIQVIGRITRMDTAHKELNVNFIALDGTIDVYKSMYFMHNANLINDVLGGNANIPRKGNRITKDVIVKMRKELLWKMTKK